MTPERRALERLVRDFPASILYAMRLCLVKAAEQEKRDEVKA